MKEKTARYLRPSRKWTDILPIAALLAILLALVASVISGLLAYVIPFEGLFTAVTGSSDVAEFILLYFLFFGDWLVFFFACGVFRYNRPILKKLAPNKSGNNFKGVLAGLALGFGTNGLCILIAALCGDIRLSFNRFDPLVFFILLVCVLIQSGAEELTDRAYFYQKLRRRYKSPVVAIAGTSLVFAAMHLLNPGVTFVSLLEIFTNGVVCALFVYYYDSLWVAIAYHMSWNFTQNIIFGLPNSGIVSEYSLFRFDSVSAKNGLFYNVDFGVEGSLGSVIVNLLIIAAILFINRGKPEKNDIWAQSAPPAREDNAE
ncbi:MAG: CPBP family intramembrane metalloprotease [Clostridia bacterium]|nr:CPBP family intramembrane metalloprotease [Clostridia bacterium]